MLVKEILGDDPKNVGLSPLNRLKISLSVCTRHIFEEIDLKFDTIIVKRVTKFLGVKNWGRGSPLGVITSRKIWLNIDLKRCRNIPLGIEQMLVKKSKGIIT